MKIFRILHVSYTKSSEFLHVSYTNSSGFLEVSYTPYAIEASFPAKALDRIDHWSILAMAFARKSAKNKPL